MHNLLFIGGAGFIGSSIIKEILQQNDTSGIYVLEPHLADVSRIEHLPVHIIRGNISDTDLVKSLIHTHKINKVIHLVSTMVPGCNYEDYECEFEKVIFPTVRLMQLCSKENVQFIFFSSGGTVYGERKSTEPFNESCPKEPISYYGLSKQVIENSLLFEHRVSGLQYLIIRPSNPYGHGQRLNARQGLIAVSLGKILSGQPITIWGDGSSVRDYIYIDDLAKVFAKLIRKEVCNTTINIGSGKGHSVKQIIDILKNVVEEDFSVEYTGSRKNDVSNMVLDNSLLRSLVGDIKLTPIEEGIRAFYEQEKSLMC